MPRAALYVRVSSDVQTVANQIPTLERMALQRGDQVVARFVDDEHSTRKGRGPQLRALLELAHGGGVDVIFLDALDRLARCALDVPAVVRQLDAHGVRLVSAAESWLDAPPGPARDLMVSIFGWFAEQERRRLSERTVAGMARARSQGKAIGRPKARLDLRAASRLLEDGVSLRATARAIGVSETTLRRACAKRGAVKEGA